MSTFANNDFQTQLQRFGLQQFRPGQREVIEAVLAGEDCLCIMPTGGGKSLCYQLPAIARGGVTLVVSPLIALMKDQVDGLNQQGIRAAFINSTLDASAQAGRIANMQQGELELVYVAPERFRSPRFMEAVRSTRIQLLAVDEAHCISEWGHDFRPDYTRLGEFRRRLGSPQTIALTATATPDVRKDVTKQLGLQSPRTFVAGFERPNLQYRVRVLPSRRDKEEALKQFLRQTDGAGIIYASTRKGCEEVAENAAEVTKRSVGVYHAGMELEQRRQAQEDFMAGRLQIVVATNAFGMGIDKADVRFVVHYNFPGSIEAYYQEAGRAGRDGQPAACLLLYCSSDRHIQEFFIESAYPSPETVAEVYEFLRDHPDDPIEITQQALKEQLGLSISSEGVGTCERLLEKSGVLKRMDPHGNMAAVMIDSDLPTLVDLVPKQAQVRRKVLAAVEKSIGTRRHETVYFSPPAIAQATALPLTSVTRVMRELNQLADFDYVPPFRGRAIHLTRRDLQFAELSIDFASMEQRRQADWDKLNRVVHYAKTNRCRQNEVLRYFGETAASPCGHCDNCSGPRRGNAATKGSPSAAEMNETIVEAVKMVLSGVARTHGRFGKTVIGAMLWGSKSAKMTRWKLDRLSTFGLLNHLKQGDVLHLIDAMIEDSLLEQIEVDRFRPVVQLTERGRRIMLGQDGLDAPLPLTNDVQIRLSAKKRPKPARPAADPHVRTAPVVTRDPPPVSSSAKGASQATRRAADSNGPSPPPAQRDSGGESRVRGGKSLSAARPREDGGHELPAPTQNPVADIGPRSSFYWTWRLLADGYAAADCAAIRRLGPDEVLDHVVRAAEDGLPVDCRWLLSSAQISVLEKLANRQETPQQMRQTASRLPDGLRIEHLMLFLKSRTSAGTSGI